MKDYVTLSRRYEADVVSGVIPACKWVRLACERNIRDLMRQETPAFPYRFDDDAARQICEFAEQLPHVKGPKATRTSEFFQGSDGKKYAIWNTIALEPWQCWVLTTIFGWKREDGLRRFRIAFPLIPRKNGKSILGAIVVLYMLTCDGESGAECYSAATTREQAKAVAEIAWEMARRSRAFCEYFGVRIGSETTKTLYVPAVGSKFLALSADANSLDGLNVSLAVIDELHAHRTRAVWDVLDTATGARLQPLLFPITTAGVDIAGICFEKLIYLQRILDRAIEDETFFGVYYTLDEGDDWRATTSLRKANPNYGVSVHADDLQRKVKESQHSPAGINNFLTKHCNVWVTAEANWLPMEAWHACADATLALERVAAYPCWIGVDLAEVRDISAVVALFRLPEQRFAAIGRFYLPEKTIEHSPVAQYPGWVRQGYLCPTEGSATDYRRIEDDLAAWCQILKVQAVCFDRALAAQMGQQLHTRLGRRPPVVTVNQSVDVMNPAMQAFEALILEGRFAHPADPVLTWMASNVVVQRNYKDEIYPRKAGGKDSYNKIDGMVALLTAGSLAFGPEMKKTPQFFFMGGSHASATR